MSGSAEPPRDLADVGPQEHESRLKWLARAVWVLALILGTASIALATTLTDQFSIVAPGIGGPAFVVAFFGVLALVALSYATAGLLIVRHHVRHAVGWMLLVAGPAMVALIGSFALAIDFNARGDTLGVWLFLAGALCWWPVIMLAGPAIALVFPDGRLPSPRWRLPTALVLGFTLVSVLFQIPRPFDGGPQNPLAIQGLPGWLYQAMDLALAAGILAPLALAAGALVARVRSAGRDERQQLKWFVFAAVLWAVIFTVTWLAPISGTALVSFGSLLLIPAAIVVAITRYRLYEIDTLINRTLVYLSLIGVVAGLYAALIVLFQRLFLTATGDESDAAAIISALILAAVFHPIRKLIEGVVDRRFNTSAKAPSAASGTMLQTADGQLGVALNTPEFDAAVERIVRRLLGERS